MAKSERLGAGAKFKNTFLALALTGAMGGPIDNSSYQVEEDIPPFFCGYYHSLLSSYC